jgi:hypothetical protein
VPSASLRRCAARGGVARREPLTLGRSHLANHELPLGYLLADIPKLLFALLLLAQLHWAWRHSVLLVAAARAELTRSGAVGLSDTVSPRSPHHLSANCRKHPMFRTAGSIRTERLKFREPGDAASVMRSGRAMSPYNAVSALVAIAQQSPRSPHYYRRRNRNGYRNRKVVQRR